MSPLGLHDHQTPRGCAIPKVHVFANFPHVHLCIMNPERYTTLKMFKYINIRLKIKYTFSYTFSCAFSIVDLRSTVTRHSASSCLLHRTSGGCPCQTVRGAFWSTGRLLGWELVLRLAGGPDWHASWQSTLQGFTLGPAHWLRVQG